MLQENFVGYLRGSIHNNWDLRALTDYQGESFTYSDVAHSISLFHRSFQQAGINKGDHIAILGKNSARWCILYITVVTYGAVVVPILPDFKPDDIHHIVDHSDSVLLFADSSLIEKLNPVKMAKLRGIVSINNYEVVRSGPGFGEDLFSRNGLLGDLHPDSSSASRPEIPEIPNDKLAVISYTSGTTGFTKGVMLPHNSLTANIRFAHRHMPLNRGDRIVSFLPLAHTFGCAFEFLFPFTLGCDITILTKTPSPQIILKAFQEVRPSLVLSVPLVIEKIFKKQLLPVISAPKMKLLLTIPGIKQIALNKIRERLSAAFGGNFREIVIGGAPFNQEAERFFKKMKFPFTVGYGMTECGPLISYAGWQDFVRDSSGKTVDTLMMRIEPLDEGSASGEILVRGENVMMGYYKNEEATREVLDEDGWLHTGDLGYLDKAGNVFIKGRIKSLILGPSGKNIYPEEIESAFNTRYAVGESLVVQRHNKLIALIYPDYDEMEKGNITQEDLEKIYEHHRKAVNHHLAQYMNVSGVEIHPEEFIKTPKRNIKRFLYS